MICNRLDQSLKSHQAKFDQFLLMYNANGNKQLNLVKEGALNAIIDSKLPEKLAITN